MGKAMTKKQNTEVSAALAADFGAVTHDQELSAQDIAIPKLLIMQPQSPKVISRECGLGDVVDTSSWETFASAASGKEDAKPMEFIPFSWNKYWIIKRKDGTRFKTEKLVKIDRTNQHDDPFEVWVGEDGTQRQRVYLHLFYGLIPGKKFPYVLGFKGASKKAGDVLVTQMYTINPTIEGEAHTKSPMGTVMQVTPQVVSKEDSTYVVLETKAHRQSTVDEAVEALGWYNKVAAGQTKVDLKDIVDDDHVNKETGEF